MSIVHILLYLHFSQKAFLSYVCIFCGKIKIKKNAKIKCNRKLFSVYEIMYTYKKIYCYIYILNSFKEQINKSNPQD